jgi:uncharacterized membrane protein YphA (DoxX/SURF4 family)
LAIVSVVLMVAGAAKFVRPLSGQHAFSALGVVAPRTVVRLVGVAELGLAAVVLLDGGRGPTALLALAYLCFAAGAVRLRRAHVPCGCFGSPSSAPPGLLHVAVNLAAATVGIVAVWTQPPGMVEAWRDLPIMGLAHAALILIGSAGVIAILTDLRDVAELGRQREASAPVLFGPVRRGTGAP